MSEKVTIGVIKAKSIDSTEDINKMIVHLQQVLSEKEKVDVKVRQSVTESMFKECDFIVFAGWDCGLLSHFFQVVSFLEKSDLNSDKEKVLFIFDEPGSNFWRDANNLLTTGMDLRRVDSKIFSNIVDCWSYRDIISYIDLKLRKLNADGCSKNL